MRIRDFVARIEEHPELDLSYADDAICIIRYIGPHGEREFRLGLCAVRRMDWEQIVEAGRIPMEVHS